MRCLAHVRGGQCGLEYNPGTEAVTRQQLCVFHAVSQSPELLTPLAIARMNSLLANRCQQETNDALVLRGMTFPAGVQFPEHIRRPITFELETTFSGRETTGGIRQCRDISVVQADHGSLILQRATVSGSVNVAQRSNCTLTLEDCHVTANVAMNSEMGTAQLVLRATRVDGNCTLNGRTHDVQAVDVSLNGGLYLTGTSAGLLIEGAEGAASRLQSLNVGSATFSGPIQLRNVEIAQDINGQGAIFHTSIGMENCVVAGNFMATHATLHKGVAFDKLEVKGDADFSGSENLPSVGLLEFGRTVFRGNANFNTRKFANGAHFHRCTFHKPPTFFACTFHQDITFPHTGNFKDTSSASAVAAYRTLKQGMEGLRARREEGTFYALEQRSQRQQAGTLRWPERAMSWLYGSVSDYGQNFSRPVWLFGLVGVIFAAVYAAFITGVCAPCKPDWWAIWRAAKWSVEFSVNPFSVWRKEPVADVAHWGILQLVATFQSLAALTLIALFLLALRWRFKRD